MVDERLTGLAFGIVTSMQNLACAVIPLAIAAIYSSSDNLYIPQVELLFVILAMIGFVVGMYLSYYDSVYGGGILNLPYIPSIELSKSKDELLCSTDLEECNISMWSITVDVVAPESTN